MCMYYTSLKKTRNNNLFKILKNQHCESGQCILNIQVAQKFLYENKCADATLRVKLKILDNVFLTVILLCKSCKIHTRDADKLSDRSD